MLHHYSSSSSSMQLNLASAIPSSPPEENNENDALANPNFFPIPNPFNDVNEGLGRWQFDKKTRKRLYISLTGKTLEGAMALQQSRMDRSSKQHPANSARSELHYLMTHTAPNTLDDLFVSNAFHGPGMDDISSQFVKNDPLDLVSWGVPVRVVNKYAMSGISKMFSWQIECLGIDDGKVLRGGNLIYSAPTSGGKTLVAEMLMLRRLGKIPPGQRGTIFFVVPFVALAEEKAEYFRTVFGDMYLGVRAFHGENGGAVLTDDVDIAVCTIERANIMLNALLEQEKEQTTIRMIVIDEIHMLSDTHRGFLLELLLSKTKYLFPSQRVQIVGMSATLPNISDLAGWLDASLYTTEFRPVNLSTKVCFDRQLYVVKNIADIHVNKPSDNDKSPVGGVENSTLISNASVLNGTTIAPPQPLLYPPRPTTVPYPALQTTVLTTAQRSSSFTSTALSTLAAPSSLLSSVSSLSLPQPPGPQPPQQSIPLPQSVTAAAAVTAPVTGPTLRIIGTNLPFDPMAYTFDPVPSETSSSNSNRNSSSSSSSINNSSNDTNNSSSFSLGFEIKKDYDGMYHLCLEPVLQRNKSVLLFCATKANVIKYTEELARVLEERRAFLNQAEINAHLHTDGSSILAGGGVAVSVGVGSNMIPSGASSSSSSSRSRSGVRGGGVNDGYDTPDRKAKRWALLNELRMSPVGICDILKLSIPQGVAYHHSGLCAEERRIIEGGFKSGAISILVATSTLAAGVNLPAHQVLIKGTKLGATPLPVSTFRQMCGRAGRLGLHDAGEAILMIRNTAEDKCYAKQLVTCDIEPLISHLHVGAGGGLEKLLLEMICCGRLKQEREVKAFIGCTLMNTQHSETDVENYTRRAMLYLREHRFVSHTSGGNDELIPSSFGRATAVSGITPMDAVPIFAPLEAARRKLILTTGFHLVFLVTPPHTSITPNWQKFEEILSRLFAENKAIEEVCEYIGVHMSKVQQYRQRPPEYSSTKPDDLFYKRVFSAIILFKLTEEIPLADLGADLLLLPNNNNSHNSSHGVAGRGSSNQTGASSRGGEHGRIQVLQKDAQAFCNMAVVFCRKLNWDHLAACLETYIGRLGHGVREDLLPLVRMSCDMTSLRARAFVKHGIHTPLDVVTAGLDRIVTILVEQLPFTNDAPTKVGRGANNDIRPDTPTNNNTNGSEVSITNDPRIKQREACTQLAKNIIKRAQYVVAEEVSILNNA